MYPRTQPMSGGAPGNVASARPLRRLCRPFIETAWPSATGLHVGDRRMPPFWLAPITNLNLHVLIKLPNDQFDFTSVATISHHF